MHTHYHPIEGRSSSGLAIVAVIVFGILAILFAVYIAPMLRTNQTIPSTTPPSSGLNIDVQTPLPTAPSSPSSTNLNPGISDDQQTQLPDTNTTDDTTP